MKITQSELKTDQGGFNSLKPRHKIVEAIDKYELELVFVDTDKTYWRNENDTMVFYIQKGKMVEFAQFIVEINPDEFQVTRSNELRIKETVRLWWD